MRIKVTVGKTVIDYEEQSTQQPFVSMLSHNKSAPELESKHELFINQLRLICEFARESEKSRIENENSL